MTIWYALTRFEKPPEGGEYPVEGFPLCISVDPKHWGDSVDGKQLRVIPVVPLKEVEDALEHQATKKAQ